MYINPFVLGVLTTIITEVVVLFTFIVFSIANQKKSG